MPASLLRALVVSLFLLAAGAESALAQSWSSSNGYLYYDQGVIVGSSDTDALFFTNGHPGLTVGANSTNPWSLPLRFYTRVTSEQSGNTEMRYYGMWAQDLGSGDHAITGSDFVAELRFNSRGNFSGSIPFSVIQGSDGQSQIYVKDKMGIGTRTPDKALAVNGTIRAREVLVEEKNWPDFVFGEGYDLPTIEEVARHVEANGHLPGVPSKDDVAAEGVALGEMDATLLRKIEELTLYAIERNEEVDALKKKVDRQQEQIERLKKQVERLVDQVDNQ